MMQARHAIFEQQPGRHTLRHRRESGRDDRRMTVRQRCRLLRVAFQPLSGWRGRFGVQPELLACFAAHRALVRAAGPLHVHPQLRGIHRPDVHHAVQLPPRATRGCGRHDDEQRQPRFCFRLGFIQKLAPLAHQLIRGRVRRPPQRIDHHHAAIRAAHAFQYATILAQQGLRTRAIRAQWIGKRPHAAQGQRRGRRMSVQQMFAQRIGHFFRAHAAIRLRQRAMHLRRCQPVLRQQIVILIHQLRVAQRELFAIKRQPVGPRDILGRNAHEAAQTRHRRQVEIPHIHAESSQQHTLVRELQTDAALMPACACGIGHLHVHPQHHAPSIRFRAQHGALQRQQRIQSRAFRQRTVLRAFFQTRLLREIQPRRGQRLARLRMRERKLHDAHLREILRIALQDGLQALPLAARGLKRLHLPRFARWLLPRNILQRARQPQTRLSRRNDGGKAQQQAGKEETHARKSTPASRRTANSIHGPQISSAIGLPPSTMKFGRP